MPNRFHRRKRLSLQEFEDRFPDDEACAEHLFRIRFPDGFACPRCGGSRATRLQRPRGVHECRDCKRQTSATAGTFMHRSHVPRKRRFRSSTSAEPPEQHPMPIPAGRIPDEPKRLRAKPTSRAINILYQRTQGNKPF